MQKIDSFIEARDGLKLHTTHWAPDEGYPRGIVIIAHGLAEHAGRYLYVASTLVNNGYAVHALDHRGHGTSEGVGAYFDTIHHIANDFDSFFSGVISSYAENTSVFLYGHSMGSLVNLLFILNRQPNLAGWICSGSTLNLDTLAPAPTRRLVRALRRFVPKLPLVRIDPEAIARNPEAVEAYLSDPLVYTGRITANVVVEHVLASSQARKRLNEITTPLLILHGAADPLTPPSGSRLLFEQAAASDKTLKIYEGLRHEIHQEPERDIVLNDILSWMASR